MTDSADVRLRHGYRVIRLVTGERDSPWPGELLAGPSGETVLAVDAALLAAEWRGWDADPSGHILAPRDVRRRPDGHDVLLPVCIQRLEEFMSRRAGTAGDLAAGEAVTIAVSMLRGFVELGGAGEEERGTWWLTADGRPVFATGAGQTGIREQTVSVLRRISADVPGLADGLTTAIEAMSDVRHRLHDLTHAETLLFAVAEPQALATTTFGPRRARDSTLERTGELEGAEPPRTPWPFSLSRHLDAEWAELVSRTTTGVWRAVRARRSSRRRPWLFAGGVAAVVIIGGFLWPSGEGGPATAVDAPVTIEQTATPAAPAATETPTPRSSPLDVEADLATITSDLLTRRTACGDDSSCLEGVLEVPEASLPSGASDLPAGQRELSVLDEFGGAAVLRVDAREAPAVPQLVVIVRKSDRWLIRDVFDVADQ